jgi:hypothetical protein
VRVLDAAEDPPTTLTPAQKRALVEDGYVHLEGVIAAPLVDEALRAINASLGSAGMPREQLATFRASTFTPDLVASEPIRALYRNSALAPLTESAVGAGQVRPPETGQIALRFPTLSATPAVPHIDGVAYPGNGVPPGTLQHFTALAGVFLSDALGPDRGNFTVWPGSHRKLEAHVRQRGPEALVNGLPPLDYGPPRPLAVHAGDALIAHYLLAHAAAPNLGPHIRYAVFFRLAQVDHNHADTRPLSDLWREWAGIGPVE